MSITQISKKVRLSFVAFVFAISTITATIGIAPSANAAGPTKKVFSSSTVSVFMCKSKSTGVNVRFRVQNHTSSYIARIYVENSNIGAVAQGLTPYGSASNNGGNVPLGAGNTSVRIAYKAGDKSKKVGSTFYLKMSTLPVC